MNIPLLDLKMQYISIRDELTDAVTGVMQSGEYIMGKHVEEFEKEIAEYLHVRHAVSVASGTDALVIALKALGIGPGDEVVTSPFTFFATAESISAVGATPVFADIDPDSFNIDPSKIEEKISDRTKAILPVHLFGRPCCMDEINEIAAKNGLFVIEDACQAIGSRYKGRMVGCLADAACFSFFPTKNLGCAGDGGLIATNNDKTAVICKALRQHGGGKAGREAYRLLYGGIRKKVEEEGMEEEAPHNPPKYHNYIIGCNSRLDAIQAAILRVKLRKLNTWNEARRCNAKYYDERLRGSEIETPASDGDVEAVYNQYVIKSPNRDDLAAYLARNGIGTAVYYPVPLHLQKAYGNLGYKHGDLPVAEQMSEKVLAIPVYPELTQEQKDYIVENILAFQKEMRRKA